MEKYKSNSFFEEAGYRPIPSDLKAQELRDEFLKEDLKKDKGFFSMNYLNPKAVKRE